MEYWSVGQIQTEVNKSSDKQRNNMIIYIVNVIEDKQIRFGV